MTTKCFVVLNRRVDILTPPPLFMDERKWIANVLLAGLNRIREDKEGNRLDTFGDLYAEHDRLLDFLGYTE